MLLWQADGARSVHLSGIATSSEHGVEEGMESFLQAGKEAITQANRLKHHFPIAFNPVI